MAKDDKNQPQQFGDVAPVLGEAPSPVPAQNMGEAPQQDNPIPLPRVDTGEVQPTPILTPRTVVLDPTPPPSTEQVLTNATYRVAPLPAGLFVELARLLFGDTSRAAEIADLNKDKITNPDAVIVGTVVRVPDK